MGDISKATTSYTNGMDFRHLVSNGTEVGHRTKRNAFEIHVQSGNDNANASASKFIADIDQAMIKELSLINANDLNVTGKKENTGGIVQWRRSNGIAIVADHIFFRIANVNSRFENLHLLTSKLSTFHPSYKFFRLTRKH